MPNIVLTYGSLPGENSFHFPSWITVVFKVCFQESFGLFFPTISLGVRLKKVERFSLSKEFPAPKFENRKISILKQSNLQ